MGSLTGAPDLRVGGTLVSHTQPSIQLNLNSGHLPIQTKSINAAGTERKKTAVTSMDTAITKIKHVNHRRAANILKLECLECISKIKCSCVRSSEKVTQARGYPEEGKRVCLWPLALKCVHGVGIPIPLGKDIILWIRRKMWMDTSPILWFKYNKSSQILWSTLQLALLPNPPSTLGAGSQKPFCQLWDSYLQGSLPVPESFLIRKASHQQAQAHQWMPCGLELVCWY